MKRIWLLLPALLCVIQSASRPQSIAFPGPGIGPYGSSGFNGFLHNRDISINPASTLVPSTQTNFPVLITGTLAYLAVVGSSGQINNTTTLNGYTVPADLSFTSDSGCNTPLNWEVEPAYVTSTGAITVWVNVPSLGTGVTHIWMCYNKVANTTYQGNATSTWDSNFVRVFHMADGNTNTVVVDSTAAATNGVNAHNTNTTTGTGQFNRALTYNGSTDWTTAAIDLSAQALVTVSAWINWTTFANDDKLAFEFGTPNFPSNNGFVWDADSSVGSAFLIGSGKTTGGTQWSDTFTRPSAAAWHYYSTVLNRTTPVNLAYRDGISQTLTMASHTASTMGNFDNTTLYFMSRSTSSLFGAGSMQEVRISKTTRTANWVTTEYNNQSNPSAFSTIGAEN